MMKKGKIPYKSMNPALENMSQYQRDAVLLRASHKANKVISLMVLSDKFDFEREDLVKFLDEFQKQIDSYSSGHIETVSDFEKVLKEEHDIIVDW